MSRGRFGKPVLTFRPKIVGGDYCTAYIDHDEMYDLYNDLRGDYPESENPKEDLQRLITYVLDHGRFFDEDGDEIDEYQFTTNNDW